VDFKFAFSKQFSYFRGYFLIKFFRSSKLFYWSILHKFAARIFDVDKSVS